MLLYKKTMEADTSQYFPGSLIWADPSVEFSGNKGGAD